MQITKGTFVSILSDQIESRLRLQGMQPDLRREDLLPDRNVQTEIPFLFSS